MGWGVVCTGMIISGIIDIYKINFSKFFFWGGGGVVVGVVSRLLMNGHKKTKSSSAKPEGI